MGLQLLAKLESRHHFEKTNRFKEALHIALAGPKIKRLTVIKPFSLQALPSKIQQILIRL